MIPKRLSDIFREEQHMIWTVGGAVRDHFMGLVPHDIDLATTATPDEQKAIYEKYRIRYFATGEQHGTLTVVLDQPYEITTLRIDRNQDGRHADVEFGVDAELLKLYIREGFNVTDDYAISDLLEVFRRITQ